MEEATALSSPVQPGSVSAQQRDIGWSRAEHTCWGRWLVVIIGPCGLWVFDLGVPRLLPWAGLG